jgi:antitoxin component of RelBE/YafQ-DinJ toxin-antitoxin module
LALSLEAQAGAPPPPTNRDLNGYVKTEGEALFSALGTSLEEAVNAFLIGSPRSRVSPLGSSPNIPNAATLAALKEAEELVGLAKAEGHGPFKDFEEMMAGLVK